MTNWQPISRPWPASWTNPRDKIIFICTEDLDFLMTEDDDYLITDDDDYLITDDSTVIKTNWNTRPIIT